MGDDYIVENTGDDEMSDKKYEGAKEIRYGSDWDGYPEIRSISFNNGNFFMVGESGVTEIRKHDKNGMYCTIPYAQVFVGDTLIAEYCEHNLAAVDFDYPPEMMR